MKARQAIAGLSLLAASLLLSNPAWPTDDPCGAAPQQLDDWETASPEDVGLDAAALCKITQELAAQGSTAARSKKAETFACNSTGLPRLATPNNSSASVTTDTTTL